MGVPRKRQFSIWKSVKAKDEYVMQPQEVAPVSSNPWSDEDIKRVASVGLVSKPSRRLRAFTGQIMLSSISMSPRFNLKSNLLKVGISLFLAADLALAALFIKSIF
jgi:hypothetical protein